MPKSISDKDIRTLAYVLRRTNYGEADRILNLITPKGKIAVIARGVRKEKSKLAGGVELFSLIEINAHNGKSDLGVLTGAKMVKYDANIVRDFNRLELASMVLKKISLVSESSDSPEYFKITDQVLSGLDLGLKLELVESWFLMNLSRAVGEEINLYRDADGEKLEKEKRYDWDGMENAFLENATGKYGADEIKFLRLILTVDLLTVSRVKVSDEMMMLALSFARMVSKI